MVCIPPPQYGLYTAIVAGLLIALTGGSRFSVSGPTAAFIVVLHPIAEKYGLGGLVTAGCMAGIMLIGMGVARMGKLIQFIPYPVTASRSSSPAYSSRISLACNWPRNQSIFLIGCGWWGKRYPVRICPIY